MYSIVFRPIADEEYIDALKWYDEKSEVASAKFVTAVNNKLDRIGENPKLYKKGYHNFHEVNVSGFPYSIVYLIEEFAKRIIIVAIYHHSRNPRKKYKRNK